LVDVGESSTVKKYLPILLFLVLIVLAGLTVLLVINRLDKNPRSLQVIRFIRNPEKYPHWEVAALERCNDAPFLLPTDGYIGFLWDDSFRPGHHHTGLDIFGGTEPGIIPIYAVYDGYLNRESDWKSTVIMRVPSDPLNPDHQIWLYYTHMADPYGNDLIVDDFPPGSHEVFVPAGTLLGYQGNFSGKAGSPTGVHLHFSIVKDDGNGGYLNETILANTLDPSPYFNINLNAKENPQPVPLCSPVP
jgi:murein DD-endopeptidase MepM/ murein hydrolase activator NlpD